jgi:acetaldehyde dehydrogenase
MDKVSCAIIGSGNIGMNLLYKIRKSKLLECTLLVGRNASSPNLLEAKEKGYFVSAESNQALIKYEKMYDIIFDATTAESHKILSPILNKLDKFSVDLTPSKVGKLCIPCLNKEECLKEKDVNMVTCGGQSMVPIAVALKKACPQIKYFEVIATISSASAGAGTRGNIDEYIITTQQALRELTKVDAVKAMIVLNPAKPPVTMRNTLYARVDNPDMNTVLKAVSEMESNLQQYVPGFKIIVLPTLMKENIIAVTVQVEGTGDYLPEYAGNLDIITCAALEMAEYYASDMLERGGMPF